MPAYTFAKTPAQLGIVVAHCATWDITISELTTDADEYLMITEEAIPDDQIEHLELTLVV